jgi:hypothetical protein
MAPTETQHELSSTTHTHHACSGYKSWFKTAWAGLQRWSIHVPQFLASLVWQEKRDKIKKEHGLLHLDIRCSGRWRSSSGDGAVANLENFLMNLWIVQQVDVVEEYLFLVCDPFPIPCMPPWTNNWRVWWRRQSVWLQFDQTPHAQGRNLNCQIHRSKLRTMSTVTVCPVMPTWPWWPVNNISATVLMIYL